MAEADPAPAVPSPEPSGEPVFVVPKRPIWPVLLVVAMALGIGGWFGYRALDAPEPLRVLLAIEFDGTWWGGDGPAFELTEKLADRLTNLGFSPVRRDSKAVAILTGASSPEEAARKLRAAFVVTGKLTPTLLEHPVEGGYFELRVDAPVTVRHIGETTGREARLTGFAGAKDRAAATKALTESMADKTFDAVLGGMTRHPTIAALFADGGDPALAGKITPAREYVKARDRRMSDVARFYDEAAKKRLDAEKGPVPVTYHGVFSSQDQLCGAGRDGFLVKTGEITPFFSPDSHELYYYESLETLEWRTPDGAKKPLWSGYHVFTYSSAAPEGTPAVFVEDLFGWAKTITVADAAGSSRRLRIDPEHRFVGPRVAPGGKAAAFYDRACQQCPDGLLVLSLEDGKDLYKADPAAGALWGFAWIDATRLAFFQTPPGGTETLLVLDLGASPPSTSARFKGAKDEEYLLTAASLDGRKLAVEIHTRAAAKLGVLDVGSGALTRYEAGGFASWPTFSPDAGSLTFEQQPVGTRVVEIAVITLADGKTRTLTDNPYEDHYPSFSADGSRIFYESRGRDPNFPRRGVSVVASVPARP